MTIYLSITFKDKNWSENLFSSLYSRMLRSIWNSMGVSLKGKERGYAGGGGKDLKGKRGGGIKPP